MAKQSARRREKQKQIHKQHQRGKEAEDEPLGGKATAQPAATSRFGAAAAQAAGALTAICGVLPMAGYNQLAIILLVPTLLAYVAAAAAGWSSKYKTPFITAFAVSALALGAWLFYNRKPEIPAKLSPVTIITGEQALPPSPTSAPIAAPRQSNAAERAHEQIKQAPAATPVLSADAVCATEIFAQTAYLLMRPVRRRFHQPIRG